MTVPDAYPDPGEPLAALRGFRVTRFTRIGTTFRAEEPITVPRAAMVTAHVAAHAEREKVRIEAKARARTLLLSMLDENQRHTLEREGYFEVTGSLGGRYRLYTHDYTGNVVECDQDGNPQRTWCVHPDMFDDPTGMQAPAEGAVIAQMLALRTDEREIMERALCHGPARGFR